MARVSFKIGDEVAVVGRHGGAASRITKIVGDHFSDGWRTLGTPNETTGWSQTGLSYDRRFPGERIVPVTEEFTGRASGDGESFCWDMRTVERQARDDTLTIDTSVSLPTGRRCWISFPRKACALGRSGKNMLDHTLTTIITAGRHALARAADQHPIRAACLRDVAHAYAWAVLAREPGNIDALLLLKDTLAMARKGDHTWK